MCGVQCGGEWQGVCGAVVSGKGCGVCVWCVCVVSGKVEGRPCGPRVEGTRTGAARQASGTSTMAVQQSNGTTVQRCNSRWFGSGLVMAWQWFGNGLVMVWLMVNGHGHYLALRSR